MVVAAVKVLVCGSRGWKEPRRIVERLHELSQRDGRLVVITGGARGADATAHRAAQALGLETEVFYADWETYGKRAGIRRNVEMLDERPDLVLAFWDGTSPGTKHTIDTASARGIPVEVISP